MDKYERAGGGDKFIWDRDELEAENDKRAAKDDIKVVLPTKYKDNGYEWGGYGMRAHTNMTSRKCFWSMLVPWHNEFLAIILVLAIFLYYLVQLFFILIDQTRNK